MSLKTLENHEICKNVLERLSRLTPASPRQWGRMTPNQMICHLSDSYLVGLGERKTTMARSPVPRIVMKWGALYLPLEWPKGIPTNPDVEQGVGGTPPTEFEKDRATLAAIIRRFSKPAPGYQWGVHPMFGMMSTADWMRWGYLHADHHFRQFQI